MDLRELLAKRHGLKPSQLTISVAEKWPNGEPRKVAVVTHRGKYSYDVMRDGIPYLEHFSIGNIDSDPREDARHTREKQHPAS